MVKTRPDGRPDYGCFVSPPPAPAGVPGVAEHRARGPDALRLACPSSRPCRTPRWSEKALVTERAKAYPFDSMSTTNTATARVPVAWIVGNSSVRLWGLTGSERLERQLRALGVSGIFRGECTPVQGPVLLLSSEWLFDERTLRVMVESPATVLQTSCAGVTCAVAAHVEMEQCGDARAVIEGKLAFDGRPGLTVRDATTLQPSYVKKVLRSSRPLVLPIRPEHAEILELHLYAESYKSVTDLVTKFVWPLPTLWAVRWCTRIGIRPNAVTTVGLSLVFAVMWLFSQGHFGAGLVGAWLMTFLDTIDGKLARVTVTSTMAGHNFDHGIDLIHPPLWYTAWACGLADGGQWSLSDPMLVAIFSGYIVGRILERCFIRLIGGFSLFAWRPFDSFFRLITGRRNSNLLLLTAFTAVGRPDLGLELVAAWTVISTVVLAVRVAQAIELRVHHKTLQSWIAPGEADGTIVPRYARSFAAKPSPASALAG